MKLLGQNRRSRHDEGSSLVEFSLVAFMFVMVLLAVVEMGRLVLIYTAVSNAAHVGTRYAIVHGQDRTGSGTDGPSGPGNTTAVETVVQNFAAAGLLDTSRLTVTVNYPDGGTNANAPGKNVSVTVTYPYDPLIGYFSSALSVTLGSTSQGIITF
jgi:Flp pilus assembly protein TadG